MAMPYKLFVIIVVLHSIAFAQNKAPEKCDQRVPLPPSVFNNLNSCFASLGADPSLSSVAVLEGEVISVDEGWKKCEPSKISFDVTKVLKGSFSKKSVELRLSGKEKFKAAQGRVFDHGMTIVKPGDKLILPVNGEDPISYQVGNCPTLSNEKTMREWEGYYRLGLEDWKKANLSKLTSYDPSQCNSNLTSAEANSWLKIKELKTTYDSQLQNTQLIYLKTKSGKVLEFKPSSIQSLAKINCSHHALEIRNISLGEIVEIELVDLLNGQSYKLNSTDLLDSKWNAGGQFLALIGGASDNYNDCDPTEPNLSIYDCRQRNEKKACVLLKEFLQGYELTAAGFEPTILNDTLTFKVLYRKQEERLVLCNLSHRGLPCKEKLLKKVALPASCAEN